MIMKNRLLYLLYETDNIYPTYHTNGLANSTHDTFETVCKIVKCNNIISLFLFHFSRATQQKE